MSINQSEFCSLITKTFKQNGLGSYLSTETVDSFYRLTLRMLEENEKYNLTAITSPDKIILNHYADCLKLSEHIKKGSRIIDVGCGAGFPTLPLAIVRPDLSIVALDSTAKRVNYVAETADLLGLSNVRAIVSRAEDASRLPEYREAFDYATARAVAELRVLSELTLPFVKVGGKLIALKGKNATHELSAAKRAIAIRGGKEATLTEVELIPLEGDFESHPLISVSKAAKTPTTYPRPYAQISKKPL